MNQINPTGERLKKLSEDQRDQPVVMINLLRFRDRAAYAADSGDSPCSGEEAYQRYAEVAGRMVQHIGGRMLWLASVDQVVIGEDAERWDEAILVQYPSRKAFLEMLQIPEYRDATRHREAALEDSRLFACTTRAGELGD